MGKYNRYRYIENENPTIWAIRINKLLEEKKLTQSELSIKSGVSAPTISDWVGNKTKGIPREPRILGFQAIAKCLEVSTDYLLGNEQCETPENEEIHKLTGLSDKAINKLKKMQKIILNRSDTSDTEQKKIAACNFLLENIDKSSLLECLYNYLLGDTFFLSENGEEVEFKRDIVSITKNNVKVKDSIFFRDLNQIFFAEVQHELVRLKDECLEHKYDIESKKREEWERINYNKSSWDIAKDLMGNDD